MWTATRALACAVWCALLSAGAGGERSQLAVPRCCAAGHELAPGALPAAALSAAAAAALCRPAAAAPAPAPRIYSPARGAYHQRGSLPAHWHFADASLPECEELRAVSDSAQSYVLLDNNGSLLLHESRRSLSPSRYCIEERAALVCLEDYPLPPADCCAGGAACAPDAVRCAQPSANVSAGGSRLPEVSVPRCCAAGHALAPEALQAAALTAAAAAELCRPAPAAAAFAPLVYAPRRGTFLGRGRLPAHWRLADGALPACGELRVVPEHAAPYALLNNNGSLLLRGSRRALPPSRFCADAAAALVCLSDSAMPPSKCCVEGFAFDGAGCAADEARSAAALAELRALVNGSALGFGWPACAGARSRYAEAGALRGARLEADGALRLQAAGARLAAGAWCAEGAAGAAGARVLACEAAARAATPARSARHAVYGAGLAVGAAFLAATLAAGFALPAAHHALHWRCQTHYVAALMLGDVLLAATQLAGDVVPPGPCRALAVCMHFLFLSAFFWLNTMCFNIWWTFRDFRPTSLERGQEAWRLRVYVVYACGGPLLLAGAAALLDALPPAAAAAAPFLRPRFAVQRCWFYGDMEILVYFFGPVGVLLLVNLALFVSTTRQLTCGLWRRDEVKSTSERAALGRVCAKLVVVMGVTWGADVVSWAAGGPDYVWYATDLLNALQGVLIFLVVGCQPHAWAALKRAAAACCARGSPAGAHSSSHLPSVGESLTHTTAAAPPAPAAPAAPPAPAARLPMETVC